MSAQIQVGPPDLREADRRAIAVAKFLRHNSVLKSRAALLNGERHDFFRVKRAVRALKSREYERARARNQLLPAADTKEDVMNIFTLLCMNRMAFQVTKLETDAAQARGLKPLSGVPCIVVSPQQTFGDEDYMVWMYNPTPWSTMLSFVLAVVFVIAAVLFPLWPYRMRRLGWYVTMASLGLLVALIGISVVRLILYVITFFVAKPGLWIFPNLFEDVGFFASFKPLYAWHGERTLPPKPKKRKAKPGSAPAAAPAAAPAGGLVGNGRLPTPPNMQGQSREQKALFQAVMQRALQHVGSRTEDRLADVLRREGQKSPEELARLRQQFGQEELLKVQQELSQMRGMPRPESPMPRAVP